MADIQVKFMHPTDGRLVDVDMDETMLSEEVIVELIAGGFIAKNPHGYHLAKRGGSEIEAGRSFAQAGIKSGDVIRVIPATTAGGPDPWTIFASAAAATQLVIMVVDMWMRGRGTARKTANKKPATEAGAPGQKPPVKKINVMMSDGFWLHVDWWVHSPKAFLGFISRFKDDSRVQPQKVVFLMQGGEDITLEISTQTDRKQLDKIMKLLGLHNE